MRSTDQEALIKAARAERPLHEHLRALLWVDCPDDALARARQSPHFLDRAAAARHTSTPAAALEVLAGDGHWLVSVFARTGLGAPLPTTGEPPEALFWLAVASAQREAPYEALTDFSRGLLALAEAGALLDTKLYPLGPDLQGAATGTDAARLTALTQHPVGMVTALLAQRSDLPEPAQLALTLALQPYPGSFELHTLAARASSALALATLARSGSRSVHEAVAQNLATPASVLLELGRERWFGVDQALCHHPNSPPALLVELARRGNSLIRELLGQNNACPAEVLLLLAADEREGNRAQVARHPNSPREALARLARDESEWVRAQVAANPSCPIDLLVELREDTSGERG